MRAQHESKRRAGFCALVAAGAWAQAALDLGAAYAADAEPKRVAIIVANPAEASTVQAARARRGGQLVGRRLQDLDFAFLQVQENGTCSASRGDAPVLDMRQVQAAQPCLDTLLKTAELVVFYYAGAVDAVGSANYLPVASTPAAQADKEPRLAVADILRGAAAKSSFVSAIIIDALDQEGTDPDVIAKHAFRRVETPGRRRILAFSAPVGELSEGRSRVINAYTSRLLVVLDGEIARARRGTPLRDLRELFRDGDLVTSPTWPNRTSEVTIEGLGSEPITLAGRARYLLHDGNAAAAGGQAVDCGADFRRVARGTTCKAMLDFEKRCGGELNAAVVGTALRLRCPDELFERKYAAFQESFKQAEQQKTCAAMTRFTEQYGLDFELADAPEMGKANGLRIRICEQEAREKELAALETELHGVIGENDCGAFRAFEKKNGLRLSADQSNRLAAATKQRCGIEDDANAALRTCLDRVESSGEFCGADGCFRAFRTILPQERYFAAYQAESRRQEKICSESRSMRSCFVNDECGGEQCSLPLRLAVGAGRLLSFIQKEEQQAARACSARRERERLAKAEAERLAREQEEERRQELRRNQTFRLTLCNKSGRGRIWIVLSYYDYDASNWVVEGWWSLDNGDCNYINDHFRRGTLYFYAHNANEAWVWKGDFGLCLSWSRFRRINAGHFNCDAANHRMFRHVDVNDSEYTLRFD